MKPLLLSIMILLINVLPAEACRRCNEGAFVVHTVDAIHYSAGQDYCVSEIPSDCLEFVTRSDKPPGNEESVVWVVLTFPDDAITGITAFQFGLYHNIPSDNFSGWHHCGFLEIPDATWPFESGTGTAVAYQTPVYSRCFAAYWFAVIGAADGYLRTGDYPHGSMHAQVADDSSPPFVYDITRFGTMRWGADGENECPSTGQPGACCLDDQGRCEVMTQNECGAEGGQYQGDSTTCDPNPCHPTPTRATTWGRIKSSF
jgi:hypothetical protein